MLRKKSYRIEFEEEFLHSEELVDDNNRVIYFKFYEHSSEKEVLTEYDADGKLKKETNRENGVELDRSEYEYDIQGRIVSQKLIISDELFEEVKSIYTQTGFERLTIQDGEETEKLVKIEEGKNFENLFYFENELTERQEYKFNHSENSSILEAFDSEGALLGRTESWYDVDGELIKEKEFSELGGLMKEVTYVTKDGMLVEEVEKDFTYGDQVQVFTHEYDAKKNLIRSECRTPEGNLLEFHLRGYNSENRIIEEKGFSTGSFNAIYGTQVNGKDFHFIHRYEKST